MFDSKAAPAKAEKELEEDDDCAMSAHVPLEEVGRHRAVVRRTTGDEGQDP